MKPLVYQDILDAKKQIESCDLIPNKILMSQATWEHILTPAITRLYKMILEEGYRITHQIEHDEGFEFWLRHPDNPDVSKMTLRYPDAQIHVAIV
jgi:hypothetical protein